MFKDNYNKQNEKIEFNYEDTEEKEFYEFGAHFKYKDLFNKLNELKKKCENIYKIRNNQNNINIDRISGKSRNIQLNNHIRSINIYFGDKNKKNVNNVIVKIKTNKTSILPKSEGINQRLKLNNHVDKVNLEKKNIKNEEIQNNIINQKIQNKNFNVKKIETKSSSHPKRNNLVTVSLLLKNKEKENKKASNINVKSISSSHSKNKKETFNIKTNHLKKKLQNNLNYNNIHINNNYNYYKNNIRQNLSSRGKDKKFNINCKKSTKINNKKNIAVTTSKCIKTIAKSNIDLFSLNSSKTNRSKGKQTKSNSASNEKKSTSNKIKYPKNNINIIKQSENKMKKNSNTNSTVKKNKIKSQRSSISKNNDVNSKNNSQSNQKFNDCEKITQNLFKNKNLKHQLKYSSPNNYTNTSINKTNISIIKNKITTPNVTVFLDYQNNDKLKNEQKKSISRNNNNSKFNINNTTLNKANNKKNAPQISKMKKQIEIMKKNIYTNSLKKQIIISSNINVNCTFNNSMNKSKYKLTNKHKINNFRKKDFVGNSLKCENYKLFDKNKFDIKKI